MSILRQVKSIDGPVIVELTVATSSPGATDDSSREYAKGSLWFNVSSGVSHVCTSAIKTAAVWSTVGSTSTIVTTSGVLPTNGTFVLDHKGGALALTIPAASTGDRILIASTSTLGDASHVVTLPADVSVWSTNSALSTGSPSAATLTFDGNFNNLIELIALSSTVWQIVGSHNVSIA